MCLWAAAGKPQPAEVYEMAGDDRGASARSRSCPSALRCLTVGTSCVAVRAFPSSFSFSFPDTPTTVISTWHWQWERAWRARTHTGSGHRWMYGRAEPQQHRCLLGEMLTIHNVAGTFRRAAKHVNSNQQPAKRDRGLGLGFGFELGARGMAAAWHAPLETVPPASRRRVSSEGVERARPKQAGELPRTEN